MKISPNKRKLLIALIAFLALLFTLYVFDLMKYKTRFNELKNDEVIQLEIQVENLQNKVEQMESQLIHNENAIKNTSTELNLCRAKCKSCTYHLSGNYEN
jgi:predicted Zn-ribbon and HTH transcriptional regulator